MFPLVEGPESLRAAVEARDAARIRQLLQRPLYAAHVNSVCTFLDPHVGDVLSPLMLAAYLGAAEVIPALLEGGAAFFSNIEYCEGALSHVATQEAANLLLVAGAPLRGDDEHDPPLALACRWGRAETAAILVRAGADVNEEGGLGGPLKHAAQYLHPGLVQMLLAAGADPNRLDEADDHTPLWAVFNRIWVHDAPLREQSQTEVVYALLRGGATIAQDQHDALLPEEASHEHVCSLGSLVLLSVAGFRPPVEALKAGGYEEPVFVTLRFGAMIRAVCLKALYESTAAERRSSCAEALARWSEWPDYRSAAAEDLGDLDLVALLEAIVPCNHGLIARLEEATAALLAAHERIGQFRTSVEADVAASRAGRTRSASRRSWPCYLLALAARDKQEAQERQAAARAAIEDFKNGLVFNSLSSVMHVLNATE